jgi:hypothetical protein
MGFEDIISLGALFIFWLLGQASKKRKKEQQRTPEEDTYEVDDHWILDEEPLPEPSLPRVPSDASEQNQTGGAAAQTGPTTPARPADTPAKPTLPDPVWAEDRFEARGSAPVASQPSRPAIPKPTMRPPTVPTVAGGIGKTLSRPKQDEEGRSRGQRILGTSTKALRRAVITTEILGKPRALRPFWDKDR